MTLAAFALGVSAVGTFFCGFISSILLFRQRAWALALVCALTHFQVAIQYIERIMQ